MIARPSSHHLPAWGRGKVAFSTILVVFLTLQSCSPSNPAPTPSPGPSAPESHEGVVVSINGTLDRKSGNSWASLDEGDRVTQADVVRTGPQSSGEIQFGQIGILHLAANTTVSLSTIALSDAKKLIDVQLVVGSVTSKVAKLAGSEKYEVRTETAVAGVRGTLFTVSEVEKGTLVAVQEGSVALTPPSFDPVALETQPTSALPTTLIEAAAEKLSAASPLVRANSQVLVTKANMGPEEAQGAQVVQALEVAGTDEGSPSTTLPEAVDKALLAYAQAVATGPSAQPLDSSSLNVFRETEGLHILDTLPEPGHTTHASQAQLHLDTPEPISPAADTQVDGHELKTLVLRWKPVPGATSYHVTFGRPQESKPLKTWTTAESAVSVTDVDLADGGSFTWQVQALKTGPGATLQGAPATTTFTITKGQALNAPKIKTLAAPKLKVTGTSDQAPVDGVEAGNP